MNSLIVIYLVLSSIIYKSETLTLVNETNLRAAVSQSRLTQPNAVSSIANNHLSDSPNDAYSSAQGQSKSINASIKVKTRLLKQQDELKVKLLNESQSPSPSKTLVHRERSESNHLVTLHHSSTAKSIVNQAKQSINVSDPLTQTTSGQKVNISSQHIESVSGGQFESLEATATINPADDSIAMETIIHEPTQAISSPNDSAPSTELSPFQEQSTVGMEHKSSDDQDTQAEADFHLESNSDTRKHTVKARKGVKEFPSEEDHLNVQEAIASYANSSVSTHRDNSIYKSSDASETSAVDSASPVSSTIVNLPKSHHFSAPQSTIASIDVSSSRNSSVTSNDSSEIDEKDSSASVDLTSVNRNESIPHRGGEKSSSAFDYLQRSTFRDETVKSEPSIGNARTKADGSNATVDTSTRSLELSNNEFIFQQNSDIRMRVNSSVVDELAKKSKEKLIEEHFHVLIGLCLAFIMLIYVLIHITVSVHDILKRKRYGMMLESRRLIDQPFCDDDA